MTPGRSLRDVVPYVQFILRTRHSACIGHGTIKSCLHYHPAAQRGMPAPRTRRPDGALEGQRRPAPHLLRPAVQSSRRRVCTVGEILGGAWRTGGSTWRPVTGAACSSVPLPRRLAVTFVGDSHLREMMLGLCKLQSGKPRPACSTQPVVRIAVELPYSRAASQLGCQALCARLVSGLRAQAAVRAGRGGLRLPALGCDGAGSVE